MMTTTMIGRPGGGMGSSSYLRDDGRSRKNSRGHGVAASASFNMASVNRILYAFCRGFVDSCKFGDVFVLDSRSPIAVDTEKPTTTTAAASSGSGDAMLDSLTKWRKSRRLTVAPSPLPSHSTLETSDEPGADRPLGGGQETGPPAKKQRPGILERTLKCCVLNGCVFLFSIAAFENLLIPAIRWGIHWLLGASSGSWLWGSVVQPLLSVTFNTLWVLPFYLLSKFVNAIWFADIADTAFRNSGPDRPRSMNTVSVAIADTVFSLFVETVFLLQAKLAFLALTPVAGVGGFVNFLHLCVLHALYCFEYKWFNQGLELHVRLAFVEANWPYFLGFGLPLAAITSWPSSHVVSGAVFSIFFPLFIVSANQACIVSCDSNGSQPILPIRIFHPTIVVSNAILTRTLPGSSIVSSKQPPAGSNQRRR